MTSRPAPHRRLVFPPARRRAFTLIELLVVIAIISILMGLVTVASVAFIGQAREAATRTTIKKVDEAIAERVGAVNRWHMRPVSRLRHDWDIRGWTWEWRRRLSSFADTAGYEEAELVLSRKGVLREMLPVNQPVRPALGDSSQDSVIAQGDLVRSYWFWAQFDDVPYGLSGTERDFMFDKITDWDSRNDDGTPNAAGIANGKQGLDRPGEVFYYALLNAPVFGGQRVAEEDFRPSELIDPDNDGHLELADGWGNPLHVYRWPTRLINNGEPVTADWTDADNAARPVLFPNAPRDDLKTDPDDRAGFFTQNADLSALFLAAFHDTNTWHAPLIVSPGPDGKLGIATPDQTTLSPTDATPIRGDLAEVPSKSGDPAVRATALEELFDNITNHNGDGGL